MSIAELKPRPNLDNEPVRKSYDQFLNLVSEIRKKSIPSHIVNSINQDIQEVNAIENNGNELRKTVRHKQKYILKMLEKELKIVPKNYYKILWTTLGMSAFGLPIGVAIGTSIGNIGLLGIGLPIGMAIGFSVGSKMDKKALEEGRTLDIAIK